MKPKVYVVHTDPGHGWMAVKKTELDALGIADQISPYSYVKGATVYLEEDSDLAKFFTAYRARFGQDPQYRTSSRNQRHPIRSFCTYRAQKVDH